MISHKLGIYDGQRGSSLVSKVSTYHFAAKFLCQIYHLDSLTLIATLLMYWSASKRLHLGNHTAIECGRVQLNGILALRPSSRCLYACTYDVQVRKIYPFLLTGASIFTDGRFGGSDQEITSLLYSFNCTNTASIAKLKDCNLADNCTRVCDNPIGIQCYGNELCSLISIPISKECPSCYLNPFPLQFGLFFSLACSLLAYSCHLSLPHICIYIYIYIYRVGE